MTEPIKWITTVTELDKDGNTVRETVTTVEKVTEPEPPTTGQYL